MPLDQSFVGRTYPPTAPYEVCREKIREFAEAIGDGHPAYRDRAAAQALGHPDVLAPPTFPVVVSLPAGGQIVDDPQLGLDYSRVLHAEQRFAYTRPVYAGDGLVCTCTVEEITSRPNLDFLTVRTDVASEDGEAIVTVWTKLVARGNG
jgi:acyl dehydratase